ncbi:MAG: metallophosphoesterase family protein, partial [Chloroflexi bacterium]|nr:metallophosphoesterase family protein [Chloroflexota bacterium]
MKIALLSDVHANQAALDCVLAATKIAGTQQTWFLGDVVDRGPTSSTTLAWLRDQEKGFGMRVVVGNHDAMLAEILRPNEWETVNSMWQEDNRYHRSEVQALPELWELVRSRFTRPAWEPQDIDLDGAHYSLVHASLTDGPGFFTYNYASKTDVSLVREFTELEKRCQAAGLPGIMCFGHTHVPTLVSAQRKENGTWKIDDEYYIQPGQSYALDPTRFWLINPGSVGQPRDLDNRAAFAVLDTQGRNITFHRVSYDWRS